MTEDEKSAIRWIIVALGSPRDRYSRLQPSNSTREEMRRLAMRLTLPHGGLDTADQARMILQAIIGDEITDEVYSHKMKKTA